MMPELLRVIITRGCSSYSQYSSVIIVLSSLVGVWYSIVTACSSNPDDDARSVRMADDNTTLQAHPFPSVEYHSVPPNGQGVEMRNAHWAQAKNRGLWRECMTYSYSRPCKDFTLITSALSHLQQACSHCYDRSTVRYLCWALRISP